jgi:Transglycosylase SLT domain
VRYALVIVLAVAAVALAAYAATTSRAESVRTLPVEKTYQGKPVRWWAERAVQARRDANARRLTIHRLRQTLHHSVTIAESVRIAAITYPAFTEHRAWCIINHESGGNPYAKNPSSTASGLYQFLTSTFHSTPYGQMSIWSPLAQSLAAGWMHQNGRGREWAINC